MSLIAACDISNQDSYGEQTARNHRAVLIPKVIDHLVVTDDFSIWLPEPIIAPFRMAATAVNTAVEIIRRMIVMMMRPNWRARSMAAVVSS